MHGYNWCTDRAFGGGGGGGGDVDTVLPPPFLITRHSAGIEDGTD